MEKKGGKAMKELIAWLEMKIELYQKEKDEWSWDGNDEEVREQLEGSISAFEDTLAKAKEILNG